MMTMTLVTVWTLMSDLARLTGLLDSGERTMTAAPGRPRLTSLKFVAVFF